jgi:hypothetical protein
MQDSFYIQQHSACSNKISDYVIVLYFFLEL